MSRASESSEDESSSPRRGRLIVASSRLPVKLSAGPQGWEFEASPGGLAVALRAVAAERAFSWIGWPGAFVPPDEREGVAERLVSEYGAIPVFLEEEEYEGYYEEFSNRELWPLFHNLWGPPRFDPGAWEHYQAVNQRFADAIARVAEPGDTVWVHDYQLALVPQQLRSHGHEGPIGFFLHIPFPSSETYRALPVRESVLWGILGADLIGFHAYEYVSHFRSACLRVLGLDSEPESVRLPGRAAQVGAYPIGIDPQQLADIAAQPEAQSERERLRGEYSERKLVVGVDRLDYTKGLPQKLLGFERMLEAHPELHGKVTLVQVAAPSRTGVTEYQDLKREIDQLAGRINGRFATLAWTPLVYVNRHVPRAQLVPLFQAADVALITPVRDGMNLVSLEYVAARGDEPGELILSEFAGAASCLSGATLVNPHNTGQVASALATALTSEPDPESFAQMRDFVWRNTSAAWAAVFLERLEGDTIAFRERAPRLSFESGPARELAANAKNALLLLDWDGTMVPHAVLLSEAAPTDRVRRLLARLGARALVYLVSERSAAVLGRWLAEPTVGLVAEHGLAVRPPAGDWETQVAVDATTLREVVEPVLADFTARTPGSRTERKAASMAWHYRGADPQLGPWRARELMSVLENRLSGLPFALMAGNRVVEVRHAELSKGAAVAAILARHPGIDFALCAGDDRSDEDMFEVLGRHGAHSVSVHVGAGPTRAVYSVRSVETLLEELDRLATLWTD